LSLIKIKDTPLQTAVGLPSIIAYSQRHITAPRSARSCHQFLYDIIILYYATELLAFQPTTFPSFSNTEHRIQKWFRTIEARGKHISPYSRHFVHGTKIWNVQK